MSIPLNTDITRMGLILSSIDWFAGDVTVGSVAALLLAPGLFQTMNGWPSRSDIFSDDHSYLEAHTP